MSRGWNFEGNGREMGVEERKEDGAIFKDLGQGLCKGNDLETHGPSGRDFNGGRNDPLGDMLAHFPTLFLIFLR